MDNTALTILLGLFARIVLIQASLYKDAHNLRFNPETGSLQEYEKLRAEMTGLEENMWTGGSLILNEQNKEAAANEIFMKYKSEELRKYRNVTSENPAAMYYYDGVDLIERSNVYQLIRKMPKGANLNLHALGSVSTDWIAENVFHMDGLKLCAKYGLYWLTFNNTYHDIKCDDMKKLSVTNSSFVDKELKPYLKVSWFGKKLDKGQHLAVGRILTALVDVARYKHVFEKFHYQMLQELYDDNIMYAEIRTGFLEIYDEEGNIYSREKTVEMLIDVVEKFKKEHPDFLGAKFIFSILRYLPKTDIQKEFKDFKKFHNKFPNYIIGLDFFGWEKYGIGLFDLRKSLIKLKREKYNFYFNAGETNGYHHSNDNNLYDALLLKCKRIGNGYAVWKHPIIMEKLQNQSIAIELCPVSNQLNGLVSDLRNHPGGIYLSQDMPLVVGSDSPGFFGTKGLSTDFYYMIMSLASNKADLRTLKQLALNSILHSALGKEEQRKARDLFLKEWNKFLDVIISYS